MWVKAGACPCPGAHLNTFLLLRPVCSPVIRCFTTCRSVISEECSSPLLPSKFQTETIYLPVQAHICTCRLQVFTCKPSSREFTPRSLFCHSGSKARSCSLSTPIAPPPPRSLSTHKHTCTNAGTLWLKDQANNNNVALSHRREQTHVTKCKWKHHNAGVTVTEETSAHLWCLEKQVWEWSPQWSPHTWIRWLNHLLSKSC